jgi:hypothetical protein
MIRYLPARLYEHIEHKLWNSYKWYHEITSQTIRRDIGAVYRFLCDTIDHWNNFKELRQKLGDFNLALDSYSTTHNATNLRGAAQKFIHHSICVLPVKFVLKFLLSNI